MLHLEQTSRLLARTEEYLRAQKILLPAASTLRRLIAEQRAAHRAGLFDRMMALLSEDFRARLDGLLGVGKEGISTLQMLKEPPSATSPRALLKEAEKLRDHRKALMSTLASFRLMTRLILSRDVSNEDLRGAVLHHVPAERLEQQLTDAEEMSAPASDFLKEIQAEAKSKGLDKLSSSCQEVCK